MTLSTEQSSQTYSGNGVTSTFSVPFPVFDSSHLVVTEINASGNERTLVKDTDYTLSNTTAYQGWIVNLIEPVINYGAARSLPSGYSIRLDRQPPFTQDTDLRNAGKFDAETVEKRFDYLTMLNQRLRDKCDYILARIGTIVTQPVQAFRLMGATSGYTDLKTDAIAGAGTVNLPAASGTEQVAYQSWVTTAFASLAPLAAYTGATLVGFIQAGASAVVRTISDKMRESVSVKDFGAVGDGTTDDTAAIQAAVNAALRVSFVGPEKNYKVTGTITLRTGQFLDFMGATITQATSQKIMFDASNKADITIQGGKFVGYRTDYVDSPSSQAVCVYCFSATNLLVTNNQFKWFAYSPLVS